ncbi:MAG: hypothetical protein GC146_10655 [Limimaricola sp.]|uniref:hypothetical protein n=1 Tax=Limimaricola sp. TaxID=2211665 RepID=UPI001D66D4E6|nr:hypothetical protein [Limimaricola sp.]MBI1417670.1 hypothetical protein [Limimaricola sp.]
MTHLLCEIETTDFAGWKSAFADEAEARRLAGLTLLQMWRGADEPARVVCLFEVADRPRAQSWLDREAGFGGTFTAHFLKTV